MNKLLGYGLYLIGIILILAIIGTFRNFLINIISLTQIFSNEIDGFKRGEIIGAVLFQIALIVTIYFLFEYGNKLIKGKKK